MDSTRTPRLLPLLLAALAAFAAHAPAHAQYSWIDDHGTRVFSDRPPPPGTPASRILQAPRAPTAASLYALPAAAAPATAETKAEAAKPPQPPTLGERDADFRKRTVQRDADEHKAAEEAQRKADLAEQCTAARRNEAALTSGERMADVDARGERAFVSDDEKARRLVQVRRFLATCR